MVSEYRAKQWEDRANGHPEYISDTDLEGILAAHALDTPKNKDVLIIGVGWGKAIKELVAHNNRVYAVDVSERLLNAATEMGAKQVFLSSDMSKAPPVDLAIAHLVLQHNTEDEIFRLINEVNLKPNGFASYQYSSLSRGCALTNEMIKILNDGEQYFCSKDRMARIAQGTNKRIVKDDLHTKFRNEIYSFDWRFVRFRNKG